MPSWAWIYNLRQDEGNEKFSGTSIISEICRTRIIVLFHAWNRHQPNFFFLFNQNLMNFFLLYHQKNKENEVFDHNWIF